MCWHGTMRIERIELVRVRIPFRGEFRHALHERRRSDAVIVLARDAAGGSGLGEILPRPYLTGETVESVLAAPADGPLAGWAGRSFAGLAELEAALGEGLARAGRRLAAFAGLEVALLDLAGRVWGGAAGDVLGPPRHDLPPAGQVVGFEVPTSRLRKHCALLRLTGNRHVKVKVGLPDDLERLEIVCAALGRETRLRVDANGAWQADEAVRRVAAMARLPLASVEQPVAADDLDGMRRVREETGVPVMADESLCSLDDAERLLEARAVDIFNIRLGKCGGMLASRRLVQLARRHGLECHLGTLVGETGILSAAAEQFAIRVGGFAYLEGRGQTERLLEGDIVTREERSSRGLGLGLATGALSTYNIGERVVLRGGRAGEAGESG
jgi:muconate cycloisomerase